MYFDGKGTRQNYNEALKWFMKTANFSDDSEFMLGLMHYYGKGVRQDYSKAFEWYMRSAKQDNEIAQLNIGKMYLEGKGVRQSKIEAKEWFGKACDNGDQDGCDNYRMLNQR